MNKNKNKITMKEYWYKHTVPKLNYSFNTNYKENINICVPTFNKQLRLNISISVANNENAEYESKLKISLFMIS